MASDSRSMLRIVIKNINSAYQQLKRGRNGGCRTLDGKISSLEASIFGQPAPPHSTKSIFPVTLHTLTNLHYDTEVLPGGLLVFITSCTSVRIIIAPGGLLRLPGRRFSP